MFYILLFYTCYLFGAASPEHSHEFYSDSSMRNMRRCLLPFISKGPARELDAYLTYVSDVAYLGSCELANMPLENHRKKLLYNVYRDQLDLKNPEEADSDHEEADSDPEEPFFVKMNGPEGVHCVESVIEFGLRHLRGRYLLPTETKAYKLLNGMICGLSESLTEDKQRKFWVAWISQAPEYQDKVLVFDEYKVVRENLKGVRSRLNQYSELIEYALKTQYLCVPSDHEPDE